MAAEATANLRGKLKANSAAFPNGKHHSAHCSQMQL